MSRSNTAVLVVDVQEKLAPLVHEPEKLAWNIGRIIDAAQTLGLPIAATEQYPRGLGETIGPIADKLERIEEKTVFSCRECDSLFRDFSERSIRNILMTGLETHVCVLQTGLDLIAQGFQVYVCVDAVCSRYALDHEIALRRMEASGATLVTTETAIFEWCETSAATEFKAISQLIKQEQPVD